jgi:hypothetical protein
MNCFISAENECKCNHHSFYDPSDSKMETEFYEKQCSLRFIQEPIMVEISVVR